MAEGQTPETQKPAAVQPAPPMPHPEVRRPDLQVLLQDFAAAQRTLFDERRQFERRLSEERDRSRWEQERIRTELGERIKVAHGENEVLIRTLGRLQAENEQLRTELAIARSRANAAAPATPLAPEQPKGQGIPISKLTVVPPLEPQLGMKPLRLTEPPGMVAGGL